MTGRRQKTSTFKLDPNRFWIHSPEEELDFTLVAIGGRIQGLGEPADFSRFRSIDTISATDSPKVGERMRKLRKWSDIMLYGKR